MTPIPRRPVPWGPDAFLTLTQAPLRAAVLADQPDPLPGPRAMGPGPYEPLTGASLS